MWRSLRFRLLAATILVVLIAVGVTAFVATRRTAGEFQRYVERRSPLDDRRLAFFLARTYDRTKSWDGIQSEIAQLAQMSGQRVVVADGKHKIVADSDNKLIGKIVDPKWPPPSAALVSGGTLVGALYLDPMSDAERADTAFLAAVNRSVLVGALIAGLAALAVTLALSSRILRPVERLTEAAQRMEKGDLTVRVPVTSEDEIGQLAHAFNSMAGSLAQQEQLRRNMVTDVAHELRTPLTNLRGYLEAARDGLVPSDAALVDNLYEETMLLSRLVADLQELAQAEAGQLALLRQPASLAGIVEQAVTILRPQANAKGLTLDRRSAGRPAARGCRPRAGGTGAAQPAQQRRRPHASGRRGRRCGPVRRPGGRGFRARHGYGHCCRTSPLRFRPLLPGRQIACAPDRRRGFGPGDREAARDRPRRLDQAWRARRARDHLHIYAAGRAECLSGQRPWDRCSRRVAPNPGRRDHRDHREE